MAVDKTKNEQLLITIPNELLHQIESYWYDERVKNRSEAIRQLIRIGLDQYEDEKKRLD